MIEIKNNRTRQIMKIFVLVMIIITVFLSAKFMQNEKSLALVLLFLVILSLLLFICGYEKKQTGTRKIIIVSVMVALSVIGRFIPIFKPITALTIITAIYLGAESGFLVGSLAAFISNFYFGQGPWTPFQMMAWGIIGFAAGYLSPILKKSRILLMIYAVISGVAFSFIMDIWTVLWINNSLDFTVYKAALYTAIPYIIIYSISNVIFLMLCAKPFGEKLERIKLKYGI